MLRSPKARLLRQVAGQTGLERTLNKVVRTLAIGQIPSLVAGGVAVQEHGYARFTNDIDLIVPNVQQAQQYLSIRGFRPNVGSRMTLMDRETQVEVDLLPGGGSVGPGPLTLPMPTRVTLTPNVLTVEQLVSIKLSSHIGSPVSRLKDLADVVELVKASALPYDLRVDAEVIELYHKVWVELRDELSRGKPVTEPGK